MSKMVAPNMGMKRNNQNSAITKINIFTIN